MGSDRVMPRPILLPLPLLVTTVVVTLGCAVPRAPDRASAEALVGPLNAEFAIPGYDKRRYQLRLPTGYDGSGPVPVIYALHGGGGNHRGGHRMTCADGDITDASCLSVVADREGFAVVYPDGHAGDPMEDVRTWNAGGGGDGFQCVSGPACADNIDDIAFFDTLHEEILRAVNVDEARVYATGLSNGAAMSHRLACERSTVIAAIAPVGGGNQVAAVQGCSVARAVPVLQIHGSADPCWPLEGGAQSCVQNDGQSKVGIQESIDGWVERNGCVGEPVSEALPDSAGDGTTTTRVTHTECVEGGAVVVLLSEGGGHSWPGGWAYLGEGQIGPLVEDYSANEEIVAFFKAHALGL